MRRRWATSAARMRTFALGMICWMAAGTTSAATIHHWQFESSPGFMQDSVGGVTLTPGAGASQIAIPAAGPGSTFDDGALSGNGMAADLSSGAALTAPAITPSVFTVEMLANLDSTFGTFGESLRTPQCNDLASRGRGPGR